jgi:hypothetical protein
MGENGTKERSEKRIFLGELRRRRRIFLEEEEKILRRGGGDNVVISILTASPGREP